MQLVDKRPVYAACTHECVSSAFGVSGATQIKDLACYQYLGKFNSIPGHHHSKELSGIASCLPNPLSVRYFSTRSGSVPGYDDNEGLELELELPLAQSASVCGVAENRSQHCPGRSHAILADTVGVTV
jgi:hypothetical protein